MPGILYLIPNVLDQGIADTLTAVLPNTVPALAARLHYFIAENAKTTRAFLKRINAIYPLARPMQEIMISELCVHTDKETLSTLLAPLLAGQDVGLMSEAGVPAVADPGAQLVHLAHQQGICVRPLVGPSSLLLALMGSGLNGQNFAFHGYLPIDIAQRAQRIRELEARSREEQQTQLLIETPYRNRVVLQALVTTCKNTTLISVASHLTLPDEAIKTQTAARWREDMDAGYWPDIHKRPSVFLLLAA